jgi:hypothetical protein
VVLNLTQNGVGGHGFNGSIVLAGGITSDHVLINLTPNLGSGYNTAYSQLTGGPTLQMSLNGNTSFGTFLDPTGSISIDNGHIDRRIFGGDTHDLSFVSGANINAPSVPVPEAAPLISAALLLLPIRVSTLRGLRKQHAG